MPSTPPTHARSPWVTFALVAGSMVVGTLNYSIVFVAFPELQRAFDSSGSAVSWTMTAYSITVATLTMPCGWLADRIGRTRQFLGGVTLFAIGSALVAVAPNLGMLIAARIVQAAGLAAESPAAVAIVLAAFPPEKRSTAVGAIGGVGGIFSALGPMLGGALIDSVGWRWTFASTIPVAVATVVIGRRYLPADTPQQGSTGRPDVVGALVLMAGVSALALGIVQGPTWGWTSARIVASIAAALVLLVGLVVRSRSHPDPILDIGLWRTRTFRVGNLLGFVIAGHFGSMFLTSLILLTEGWGLSRFRGGLALGLIPAIGGPVTFAVGRLADRYGHRRVILPGALLFIVAGIFFVTQVESQRQLLAVWVPGVILYGTAVGLSHASSQSAALSAVDPVRLGRASSTTQIFQQFGNTVWVAIAVAVMAAADDTVTGVRHVYSTMWIVGVIGTALALALPRGRPSRTD